MRAMIIGCHGQDGQLMTEFLTEKGYELLLVGKRSNENHFSTSYLECDIRDKQKIGKAIRDFQPHEIYHFAGVSSPTRSFQDKELTMEVNVEGTRNVLDGIRMNSVQSKMFFASSSEVFGDGFGEKLNLRSNQSPRNPYGQSKLLASQLVHHYRLQYNLFASSGYFFNHESEYRPPYFVVQKIAFGVACAFLGIREYQDLRSEFPIVSDNKLTLGDLDLVRDWGEARQFMTAAWMTLQKTQGRDYIIGTGEGTSLRQLVRAAYSIYGMDGRDMVISSSDFKRNEPKEIVADVSASNQELGWRHEHHFSSWLKPMVEAATRHIKENYK